jgi:hypothetical protein
LSRAERSKRIRPATQIKRPVRPTISSDRCQCSDAYHDGDMNPEALAAELNRQPFVPLRLYLSDGRTLEIFNPDGAMISNLSVYLFKVRKDARSIADDTRLLSLRHIVSVEQIAAAERH